MGMEGGTGRAMKKTARQFVRYAIVGLVSNGVGFLLYLGLTFAGMEHKTAMTLLYAIGVLQSFLFNKRWSFQHGGVHGPAFLRYCIAYGVGYVVNLLGLIVLVDYEGYPHEIVQAFMVVSLAVMLFLFQKFWVFPIDVHKQPRNL
jgi:putative flippase GtrA